MASADLKKDCENPQEGLEQELLPADGLEADREEESQLGVVVTGVPQGHTETVVQEVETNGATLDRAKFVVGAGEEAQRHRQQNEDAQLPEEDVEDSGASKHYFVAAVLIFLGVLVTVLASMTASVYGFWYIIWWGLPLVSFVLLSVGCRKLRAGRRLASEQRMSPGSGKTTDEAPQ